MNRSDAERWPSFAPPGHWIGAVWVLLFAGMGAARWCVSTTGSIYARNDTRAVVSLIALCLAYPFYTYLIGSHVTELVGNVATLAYAAWLAFRVRARSSAAALLISAVALWIAFATFLVFALVRMNGWGT